MWAKIKKKKKKKKKKSKLVFVLQEYSKVWVRLRMAGLLPARKFPDNFDVSSISSLEKLRKRSKAAKKKSSKRNR